MTKKRPEFEYFQHTIEFYFVKIGLRYLTFRMYEEALYLAIKMDSAPLLNHIRILAHKQRNLMVESIVDYHKEKVQPGSSQTTLLKSIT